jgi:L-threonylcarbamoyladenylate synthase
MIERAARAIRQGKVVLYPTDTLYGLGCDPFNEKALQRLFAIKGRSEKRGVLILVQDYSYVKVVSDHIPDLFYELVKAFWPGPVTLLLEGNSSCSHLLLGEEGKVGLRHPDLTFLQLWMAAIPGPIVSTSANVSGEPLAALEDLKQLFDHQVDLILESRETKQPSQPSTVVDMTMDPPRIVRAGRWAGRVEEFLTRR